MRLMYMLMYIKGTMLFGFHSFLFTHSFSLANYIIEHETIPFSIFSRIRVAAAAAASSVARASSSRRLIGQKPSVSTQCLS